MSTDTQPPRYAAITGAGAGLGKEIAVGLARKGYVVFGTARHDAEIQDLKHATDSAVRLAICDITDEREVRAWTGDVTSTVGDRGLNALISNAGILTPGPLEVLPIEAVRREFEVNVFGGLAVINALLPALRKAHGRIVEIGAMTGRFPLPFNGPSSASKAALEAFADVYRAELKPFGVDFVLIQAGNLATSGPAKTAAALHSTAEAMTADQRALYGEAFAAFTQELNKMQAAGMDAAAAAAQVIEATEQQPALSRVPVGPDAEELLKLVREQSDEQLDALRLRLVGLGNLSPATPEGQQ